MTEDKIIERVQKLLAKAEDPACTPEEAESFFAAAQTLMVKHAIDEATARAGREQHKREKPVVVRFVFSKTDQNKPAKMQLLALIAKAQGVTPLIHSNYRRKDFEASLVGFQSDVDFTQLLYASALAQCAMAGRGLKCAERTGFMLGFANAVGERLAAAKKEVEDDAGGAALVLYDRDREVEDAMKEAFPRTTAIKTRATNFAQYGKGREAGKRADLSGGRGNVGRGGGKALGR